MSQNHVIVILITSNKNSDRKEKKLIFCSLHVDRPIMKSEETSYFSYIKGNVSLYAYIYLGITKILASRIGLNYSECILCRRVSTPPKNG